MCRARKVIGQLNFIYPLDGAVIHWIVFAVPFQRRKEWRDEAMVQQHEERSKMKIDVNAWFEAFISLKNTSLKEIVNWD